MKNVLSLLFITTVLFSSTQANQGGPDAFGYIWKDSNEPGGPSYAWWDITQIGSQLSGFGDDNFIGPKPLGGPFTYYWYTVDKCWIGSNGYISFGPGNIAAPFPTTVSPSGVNDFIGGLMADLNFLGTANPGKVYYYTGVDSFCISFVNVPFWAPGNPGYTGSNSFQIILDRTDSSIIVNFQNCAGSSQSNLSSGMENAVGNMGLFPLPTATVPITNYTLKYYYPNNPMNVADAGAMWNDNNRNRGIFVPANGNPYVLKSNIKNTGNVTQNNLNYLETVRTVNNILIVSNSGTVGTLISGDDTTLTHSSPFPPSGPGTYKNVIKVLGDTIPANDSVMSELVTVDTTQTNIRLCYTANHTNMMSNSISWNGGSGGVGMYFKPPTYPARIVNTNYVIAGTTTSGNYTFIAKIYDDNGPGGTPGTLLDSVPVLTSNVAPSPQVTVVPVSSNIVISSGGFYVNWDMAGVGASIAEDWTLPISMNSYEVFANIWSDYRDMDNADFFIGTDYMKAVPEDVGVCKIQSPLNNATLSSPTQVSCWIKNFGTQPDNYFINVNYKLGMSGMPTTQAYTGPAIPPGDSVLFTFTTLLTPPYSGSDVLCCWTSKNTDVNANNDTTCINVTLVGIDEYSVLSGVQVFPNPAQDVIHFEFKEAVSEMTTLRMMDVMGRVVYTLEIPVITADSRIKIDGSNLSAGIYSYSLISGNKKKSGKIVIE
ncbi:MAG: T9SS type A sorting domain-containing protein [Bacteroidia bacterium]|nr:T9SS type A sorting domain-containing protein [Bacteroidia bacterium]